MAQKSSFHRVWKIPLLLFLLFPRNISKNRSLIGTAIDNVVFEGDGLPYFTYIFFYHKIRLDQSVITMDLSTSHSTAWIGVYVRKQLPMLNFQISPTGLGIGLALENTVLRTLIHPFQLTLFMTSILDQTSWFLGRFRLCL